MFLHKRRGGRPVILRTSSKRLGGRPVTLRTPATTKMEGRRTSPSPPVKRRAIHIEQGPTRRRQARARGERTTRADLNQNIIIKILPLTTSYSRILSTEGARDLRGGTTVRRLGTTKGAAEINIMPTPRQVRSTFSRTLNQADESDNARQTIEGACELCGVEYSGTVLFLSAPDQTNAKHWCC